MTENDKRALKYIDKDDLGYVLESISEVAEFYGKSFKKIESWIRRGLPREKIGIQKYLYPLKHINNWLAEKNVLNFPGMDALLLRYRAIEYEALLLRQFLYIDFPVAIERMGLNQKMEVKELLRFVEEWIRCYEYEAVRHFKEAVE